MSFLRDTMPERSAMAVIALIFEVFPKTEWHPKVQAEVLRQLSNLPFSYEQGEAVVIGLRTQSKYRALAETEFLTACRRAAYPNGETQPTQGSAPVDGPRGPTDVEIDEQRVMLIGWLDRLGDARFAELVRRFKAWPGLEMLGIGKFPMSREWFRKRRIAMAFLHTMENLS